MDAIFATPWGLLALAGVPAILVLHLFWQRFLPRRIAGLFLWAGRTRQVHAGRTRDRLYRTLSLLCELLAASALAFAAAGLSLPGTPPGTHLVVVLDGSASMAAQASTGETFAGRAARRARDELDRLGAADVATVIVSGPVPFLAAGPRARLDEARAAVDRYRGDAGGPGTPAAERDGLDRALAVARELAGGDGGIAVYTDTARTPDRVPPRAEFVSVGESRPNLAIVAADRSIDVSDERAERAFVAVRSFCAAPVACAVSCAVGGKTVHREAVALQPGRTRPLAVSLRRSDEVVEISLEPPAGGDALAVDDAVRLVPPRFPPVTYANRLAGGARGLLQRALACARGVAPAGDGGGAAHLVFCARDEEVPPGAWKVVLAAPEEGADIVRLAGPYVIARHARELEDVSLAGVLWPAAREGARAPEGAVPLIACGGRVLAWRAVVGDCRTLFFDIDLARSGLTASPAWPVLVSNVVEERRRELPGLERRNLALGQVVHLKLPASPGVYSVVREGRERLPGAGSERAFDARPLGGGRLVDARDGTLDVFQVNFLAGDESDLRALAPADVPARDDVRARDRRAHRSWWPVAALAILALAAFLGDWYVLRRVRAPSPPGREGA